MGQRGGRVPGPRREDNLTSRRMSKITGLSLCCGAGMPCGPVKKEVWLAHGGRWAVCSIRALVVLKSVKGQAAWQLSQNKTVQCSGVDKEIFSQGDKRLRFVCDTPGQTSSIHRGGRCRFTLGASSFPRLRMAAGTSINCHPAVPEGPRCDPRTISHSGVEVRKDGQILGRTSGAKPALEGKKVFSGVPVFCPVGMLNRDAPWCSVGKERTLRKNCKGSGSATIPFGSDYSPIFGGSRGEIAHSRSLAAGPSGPAVPAARRGAGRYVPDHGHHRRQRLCTRFKVGAKRALPDGAAEHRARGPSLGITARPCFGNPPWRVDGPARQTAPAVMSGNGGEPRGWLWISSGGRLQSSRLEYGGEGGGEMRGAPGHRRFGPVGPARGAEAREGTHDDSRRDGDARSLKTLFAGGFASAERPVSGGGDGKGRWVRAALAPRGCSSALGRARPQGFSGRRVAEIARRRRSANRLSAFDPQGGPAGRIRRPKKMRLFFSFCGRCEFANLPGKPAHGMAKNMRRVLRAKGRPPRRSFRRALQHALAVRRVPGQPR